MASKQDLEEKKGGAMAVYDYGDDAGAGYENQTQDDIAIPFIVVLQALSPQIDEDNAAHIEGAKQGMLCNTVTDDIFDGKTGLQFVPATTAHQYVEFVPRESGGGYVGTHAVDSAVVVKARANAEEWNKLKTPDGNELTETFYVYGVLAQDGEPVGMAVLAFTSTKIKVYKRWNTKIKMFTVQTPQGRKVKPPLFAHLTTLTSVKEKGQQGDYYNFHLAPANGDLKDSLLTPDSPLYQAAKECRDLVESGKASADVKSAEQAGSGGEYKPESDEFFS